MAREQKKQPKKVLKKSASSTLPVVFQERAKAPTAIDPQSPLSIYMKEVAKYPLITPEEELRLAKKVFEENDQEAFKILVQSNLRFVVKIAFNYSRYGAKVLDLIQEGNMGLIKAVQDFNPYKNVRLTTYAVWWIRSYIQDFLLRNWSLVRIGTTAAQKKLFYRLKKEQEKLQKEGLAVTPKAIAMNLGVEEEEVATMQMRMAGRDKSISDPITQSQDGSDILFEDRVADSTPLPSIDLEDKEQSTLFKKALVEFQNQLNERERHILTARLLSENPVTLTDIGNQYNISKERTRQIEEGIKKKLKEFLSQKYPDINLN